MRLLWCCVGLLALGCAPAFPERFLFGASIAGFQVDPGCPTLPAERCVDTHSDWYQWVTSSAALSDLAGMISFEPLAHGPGHWELYDADFARAKDELGLGAVRLSVEWSRIFPTATDGLEGDALARAADPEALATYRAMFASLKKRKLTPLVTLNHYTLPRWLHDGVACHQSLASCRDKGWVDEARAVREAAKYAGFVAKELGGDVDLWATENEPFAIVLPGYLQPSKARVNPPGLTLRFTEAKTVMHALISAHARMYDAVKAADTQDADGDGKAAEVGLVYAVSPTGPKDPAVTLDVRAAQNIFTLYNLVFLDAVCRGERDEDLNGKADGAADPTLAGRMDWLGVNYYGRTLIKGTPQATFPDLSPISNFDPFDISPFQEDAAGLTEMLTLLHERYRLPLYVTETGADAATDASATERWLVRHANATKEAVKQGADVRGLFVWSLFDNYEWNQGMSAKFGLYAVDPADPSKARTPRSAVATYRRITRERDVAKELIDRIR